MHKHLNSENVSLSRHEVNIAHYRKNQEKDHQEHIFLAFYSVAHHSEVQPQLNQHVVNAKNKDFYGEIPFGEWQRVHFKQAQKQSHYCH